jgi:hypothetical protein
MNATPGPPLSSPSLALPAELWFQVMEYLSLDELWLARGTNRMFSSVAISKAIPLVANSEVSLATAIHLKDQTSSCRIVQSLHQSFPPVNTINQLGGTTPLVFYTVKTTEPPVEFLVNEPAPFRPDHLELRLPSLNIRVAYPLKEYSRRTSGRNSESRLEIWKASNPTGDFRSILTWIPDNRTGGPNLNVAGHCR